MAPRWALVASAPPLLALPRSLACSSQLSVCRSNLRCPPRLRSLILSCVSSDVLPLRVLSRSCRSRPRWSSVRIMPSGTISPDNTCLDLNCISDQHTLPPILASCPTCSFSYCHRFQGVVPASPRLLPPIPMFLQQLPILTIAEFLAAFPGCLRAPLRSRLGSSMCLEVPAGVAVVPLVRSAGTS